MTKTFDRAVLELLKEYAILELEHQRLIVSPADRASDDAHERRVVAHLRRAQVVLEQLRQKLNADALQRESGAPRTDRAERTREANENHMANDIDYEARRAAWTKASDRWVQLLYATLADRVKQQAAGERGVLEVKIDMADMQHTPSAPPNHVHVEDRWHRAVDFIEIVSAPAGVRPDTARRWTEMMVVMDPQHDVALFLHSSPDGQGRWFSRFLVVHDGNVPVH